MIKKKKEEKIKKRINKLYKNMNLKQRKETIKKVSNFVDKKAEAFYKNFHDRNYHLPYSGKAGAERAKRKDKKFDEYAMKTLLPKAIKMIRQEERKAIKEKPKFIQKAIKDKRAKEKIKKQKNKTLMNKK